MGDLTFSLRFGIKKCSWLKITTWIEGRGILLQHAQELWQTKASFTYGARQSQTHTHTYSDETQSSANQLPFPSYKICFLSKNRFKKLGKRSLPRVMTSVWRHLVRHVSKGSNSELFMADMIPDIAIGNALAIVWCLVENASRDDTNFTSGENVCMLFLSIWSMNFFSALKTKERSSFLSISSSAIDKESCLHLPGPWGLH